MNDESPASPLIGVHPELTADQVTQVQRLAEAAAEADGVPPLNEAVLLRLASAGDASVRHLVATSTDGGWMGYGHLDLADSPPGAEAAVVVHPAWRRGGVGRALVQRLVDETAPLPLRMWAHGNHPAAQRLAQTLGFERSRDLLQLRLDLAGTQLPDLAVPAGVRLRAFRPGLDEQAWLRTNAAAFAGHPEQGAMTADDLAQRMRQPWFDPQGFIVAERDGSDGLVGFHWTKVHADTGTDGDDGPVGEVYVVGVDPAVQGLGLGSVLTLAGLRHLRDRGLAQVILYVEADNAAALTVYERLGFRRWNVDVMYTR